MTNDDLMDPLQFFVQRKCLSDDLNLIERKKQSAKQKRAHLSEKLEREQIIHQKAMEELCKFEKNSLKTLLVKQNLVLNINLKTSWKWSIRSENHSLASSKGMRCPSHRTIVPTC